MGLIVPYVARWILGFMVIGAIVSIVFGITAMKRRPSKERLEKKYTTSAARNVRIDLRRK